MTTSFSLFRSSGNRAAGAALLAVSLCAPLLAQPPQAEPYCFAVADSGDNLVYINKDGDGFVNLGLTGTSAVEAIAFNPDDGRLYAINNDDFGFLDYDDGFDGDGNDSEFIQISADVGSCTLPSTAVVSINDVDGLMFDLTRTDATTGTFVLWASVRDGDGSAPDDVLVQIDPNTGLVDTTPTPGFAGGATCVRISGPGIAVDVDDIAVNPETGTITGVNNVGGGTDQLVSIDPVTGAGTIIGPFNDGGSNVNDMEGMSFGFDGQLYGTTGGASTPASNDDTLWLIDDSTGLTSSIAPFPSFGDYEAVACLTDNLVTGNVFYDSQGDGTFDPPGDTAFPGARVVVYIDNNNDGLVDAGDTRICGDAAGGFPTPCPVTDGDGFYEFVVGQGDYVLEVDVASLPPGHALTTDEFEEAGFLVIDFGMTDPGNDFGFNIPGVLSMEKSSDAGGAAVVQGQTITYSLRPRGTGSGALFNVQASDAIPAGTSFAGASPPQDSGPDPLVWDLGSTTLGVPGFEQGNVNCADVMDLPALEDTYIEQDDQAANNGGDNPLLTRPQPAGSINRALFRFDAGMLPAGATITEARLQITSQNSRSNHLANVHRVTSNWNETANWNTTNGATPWTTPGGDFDATVIGTMTPDQTQQSVDVTSLVQDWVDGTFSNFGVILDPTGSDAGDAQWESREDGTPERRPFIRAAYEFLSAGGCPATLQAQADQDTYIEEDDQSADNSGEDRLLTRPQPAGSLNRALYRFDLSTIPAGAIVDSALLTITSRNTRSDHLAEIHRVTSDWSESANWNTTDGSTPWSGAGGDFDTTVLGTLVPDQTQQQVDITALVQDWADGAQPNFGVLLDPTGSDAGDAEWAAREDGTASRRPFIEISYRSAIVSRTLPVTHDTYIEADDQTADNGGSDPVLTRPQNAGEINRSFFQFETGAVPSDATILTATLNINSQNSRADHFADVRHVTSAWTDSANWTTTDGSTPWATAGGDFGGTVYGTLTPVGGDTFVQADVAALVQDWADGTLGNFGVVLDPTGSDNGDAQWNSMEDGTPSRHAFIDVRYLAAGSVSDKISTLTAEESLVIDGDVFQLTLELTSSTSGDTNVTPGALTVTGVNGASASCTGPSPASQDVGAGVPITFTWSCTAVAGAVPGSVTLDVGAGGDAETWATAVSNSVLVTPPLTFQVQVDNPLTPFLAAIVNTGTVTSQQTAPASDSVNDPVASGALGDRVWLDVDGDGVQDVGEPGLANVEVTLFDAGPDGMPGGGDDVAVATLLTGADGEYLFEHLAPATYFVDVNEATLPAGLALSPGSTDPSATFIVALSEIFVTADFGYANADSDTAILGDYLWNDMDRDGVQDLGEIGVGGVTLELVDLATGSTVGAPVTTAADGRYLFTGVAPGEYEVRVTDSGAVLAGSSPSAGPQSEGGFVSSPITVVAGDVVDDVDFGFAPDACLPRIDFEVDAAGSPIVAGQVLDSEWSPWGVSLSFTVNAPSTGPLMAFDSFVPTGGDIDLGSPNETCLPPGPGVGTEGEVGMPGENCSFQSKLLILSEDGDSSDPDDAGDGGTIAFDFAFDVEIEAVEFIDAENSSDSVELFDDTATSIFFSNLSAPGDNAFERLVVDTAGARQMVVTFPGSGSVAAVDFCLGSIRDRVWLDSDGDGLFDVLGSDGLPGTGDEEQGIAGVTVNLLDSAGNVIATTSTDAGGSFAFDGLADGDYTISIADTVGLLNPLAPTTAAAQVGELAVTITGGGDVTGINFGYNAPGLIGDTVFSDADGDGLQDPGEAGIAGVTVELWLDADADGIFDDAVDTLVGSQVTGAGGAYLFTGLTPGIYFASIDDGQAALSGYTPTTTDQETGPNAAGTQIEAGLVNLGDSFLAADFGYRNTALANISGSVFEDLDRDGVDEAGEPPFAGITVALLDASGSVIATTTTDVNGDYRFPDLPNGTYAVRVTDDAGLLVGYSLTSGLDEIAVTLAGADVGDVDFGYARDPVTASIGDSVWLDADGDGLEGPAESGLSGVTVELWLDGGDGVFDMVDDMLIASTVTDTNGNYLFPSLGAGSYFVDVLEATLPANLTETAYPPPVDPSALISLSEGEDFNDADFGYVPDAGTAVLGDRVWYDTDGDGLQDPGEIGIEGVTIELLLGPSCDPVPCTVTTGPDGTWLATGLLPGDYAITFDAASLPAGYDPVPTNLDPDDTYTITIVASDLFTHLDFGFDGGSTGSIGDLLWLDANGDGDVDAGEVGIEGVTVNLVRDDDGDGVLDAGEPILATATTDAAGGYTFSGLPLSDVGDGDASDADYLIDVTDIFDLLAGTNKTTGVPDTDDNSQADPYPVALTAASPTTGVADFGYAPSEGAGAIGDQIWLDLDLDGFYEPLGDDGLPGTPDDERGVEGVTVQLWLDDGDGVFEPFTGDDNLLRETSTDANGEYEFLALPPAEYFVTVTDERGVLTGLTKTATNACPGADGTSKEDPCRLDLGMTPSDRGADFGFAAGGPPLSISGTVFEDESNDGSFDDPPEPGVPGATVSLYRIVGVNRFLIGTTTTDANGDYIFTGLPPGDYEIEVDPTGTSVEDYIQTTQTGTGGIQPVTISIGTGDATDQDFGFWAGPTITTPVTLAGFEAIGGGGRVTFRWTTATEAGNLGFHLWAVEEDRLRRLNDELVPSTAVDSLVPQEYTFEGYGVSSGVFLLEDVDIFGSSRYHGPFYLGEARGRPELGPRRPIDWQTLRAERENRRGRPAGRAMAGAAGDAAAATWSSLEGDLRASMGTAQVRALRRPEHAARRRGRPVAELRVDRDGIHRVTYEQLGAAGVDFAGTPARRLRLESGGEQVPMRVWSSASFGPGSYVEFVGEALDTLYTRTNVYTLRAARDGLRAVEDERSTGGGVGTPAFYMETAEVERDLAYHFAAPGDDPWYEAQLLAISDPVETSVGLELEGWVAGAAPVSLEVGLWGVTDFPVSPDHHVVVDVNGVELADEWFDGLVDQPVTVDVPDSVLLGSGDTLGLTLPHDTGADYDLVHYDRYRVTYPRSFTARDGRLSFTAAGRAFRVDGLPSAEVVVYREVAGELHHIANPLVSGEPGDYSVTFIGRNLRAEATYHVSTVASVWVPAAEPAAAREDITSGAAELLIVSHADFLEGLEPLAAARRNQGLSVKVVDVEQVYVQFGHGIFDPQAIRDYLAHAHVEMGTRFVLLVGGDTYDYHDYLGLGSMSFMPSLYARTDDIVHYAPVDALYGDLDSDGSPELAVGRLPVRTAEELDQVVDKTLRYGDVSYRGSALLTADGFDLAGAYSFSEASEEMGALLPAGWDVATAYIDDLGLEGARQALIDGIEAGTAVTSYFGHSGPTVWSFDRLFDTEDAGALDNSGLPTVVTQWGCWNTYHVSPLYDTLSHALLLADDRGAAAVLGAATLTAATSEKKLGREVFARIGQSGTTIGEAVLEAKQALAQREPHLLDVLWGWTLLGDPSLVIEP